MRRITRFKGVGEDTQQVTPSRPWATWIIVCGLLACGGLGMSCGEVASKEDATSETTQTPSGGGMTFEPVFVQLAQTLAPVPVYGLRRLPEGTVVAEWWWPVVESPSAAEYTGSLEANPLVRGEEGVEPEAQVLLDAGAGVVVILENFRGDLGDVIGLDAGVVNGRAARLYELNGAVLVQWSDGGRWYGIFGRGVTQEYVMAIAREMEKVPCEDCW